MQTTVSTAELDTATLSQKISARRRDRTAVILAHYYQEPAIQDIADHVGDSLELARWAAKTKANIIVFAGVLFMAETAKILNPGKTVLLPDLNAGCSLSDSCPPKDFKVFLDAHPGHLVVSYINCSIEIKALSDIICTSSNAEQIISSIPENMPIIFAPDKNLGTYLMNKTGRNLVLWDGACTVHEAFSIDKLIETHKAYPEAEIIAHPESEKHILKTASFIGSTAGMVRYVNESPKSEFIVATEAGILHRMKQDVPNKTLIPAPSKEDNTCSCSECGYMKMNTLQKLYLCLRDNSPEIVLNESLRLKAYKPLQECLKHVLKK